MIDDLLETKDIAALLGVRVATVRQYKLRGDLPPPDATAGRSPLWRRATIEQWRAERPGQDWRKNRPTPPRPPSGEA